MKNSASIILFLLFFLFVTGTSGNAQASRDLKEEPATTTTQRTSRALENILVGYYRAPFTLNSKEFSASQRHPWLVTEDHLSMFDLSSVVNALDQDEHPPTYSVGRHPSQSATLSFGLADRLFTRSSPGGIGAWLLRQAIAFGYQFATEKTKEGSLSDIDYLQLPKNTGIVRTMDDVIEAALQRGYRDAQEVRERNRK